MKQEQKKVSRREFIKTSAAATAVLATPLILPRSVFGANERIRVAVLGVNGRGKDHIKGMMNQPDVQVVTLCDPDSSISAQRAKEFEQTYNKPVKTEQDLRRVFDDKEIDAVTIATPNHWHALAGIWAAQAGKHAHLEKPFSHNIFEGRKLIEAAQTYHTIIHHGTESRNSDSCRAAIQLLREGVIGEVYLAKGLCYKWRNTIGEYPDGPMQEGQVFRFTPEGDAKPPFTEAYLNKVDYDLWQGPAQLRPFNPNRFHYNWHWNENYGNGDIGNQGIHEMDIALWGLNRTDWPKQVISSGGKFIWQDDQETPNTQTAAFTWPDGEMTFDVRNLPTPPEGLVVMRGPNYVGNIFFGDLGFMVLDPSGFQVFKSTAGNFVGARGAGAGSRERYEKTAEEKGGGDFTVAHMKNFIEAVKSRDHTKLAAEIEIGARSAAFCHMANLAYRLARPLKVDANGRFIGDAEANAMQTRKYRAPYVVPDRV